SSHAFIFRCQIAEGQTIQLSDEHSEYRWFDLTALSSVQRIRVEDCLAFDGQVQSRAF
ncbi:MAG: NUDIX hydrolase, partial [Acinetobacter sp.]